MHLLAGHHLSTFCDVFQNEMVARAYKSKPDYVYSKTCLPGGGGGWFEQIFTHERACPLFIHELVLSTQLYVM